MAETTPKKDHNTPPSEVKFSDILAEPQVKLRWEKVRKWFFLRESTYDMTNRCNIRCEGCYYYEGDKQFAKLESDPEAWRQLMVAEKKRGITFVVLAGAEPSLVPDLLAVCHDAIPLGAIATNGIRKIPEKIGYKIHISVWGNDDTSQKIRNAEGMLKKQIDAYRNDPRAVFIYTYTRDNIEESHEVAHTLAENDCRMTFNMFSAPVGYRGDLRHTTDSMKAVRETMAALLDQYPDHVLFSPYSIVAHTHPLGLHDLYGCPYPRRNPSKALGLGRSFRQYRADLTWDRDAACCVPDTDCDDCRHYAAGSAVVTSRMFRHAGTLETFRAWLDYADTYLAVWVKGYEKGANLSKDLIPPPGQTHI